MESSKVAVTDSSATISDGSTTETDSEIHNHNSATTTANNSDSTSQPDSSPFILNQRVFALHKNFYYDAKVIKVQLQRKTWRFKVHYHGWKTRWDEWLGAESLKEYTDENALKYQAPIKNRDTEKSAQPGQSSNINSGIAMVARGRKRKIDSSVKENDYTPLEKAMNIQIPSILKKQLFDDCDFVNNMGELVKLPRTPNVNDIFLKYLEDREQKDGLLAESVKEFMIRFQSYFDKALPAMLLYKSERQQYEQATVEGTSPSSVYGAEHLLRLFVKFPDLLSDATIEEEELADFQLKIADLLKFVRKNHIAFFLTSYNVAGDIETSSFKKQEDWV